MVLGGILSFCGDFEGVHLNDYEVTPDRTKALFPFPHLHVCVVLIE